MDFIDLEIGQFVEQVWEVSDRFNLGRLAAWDERIDDGRSLGLFVGTGKQVVFAPPLARHVPLPTKDKPNTAREHPRRDANRPQASILNLKSNGTKKIVFFDFFLQHATKIFGVLPKKPTFVPDKGIA